MFADRLRTGYERDGTVLCLGLDPVIDYIPDELAGTVSERIVAYVAELLEIVQTHELRPAAFKPNIGFYHCLDRPRSSEFEGSRALAGVLDLLSSGFPEVPVILDAKRGDIARSSDNYGTEAFGCWGADAVTAPPYIGSHSVEPLLRAASEAGGLVYILAATSNPGSADFQFLKLADGRQVAERVAISIAGWQRAHGCAGAVVGGTWIARSRTLLAVLAADQVPILVPGVGTQGGTAEEVMSTLRECGYPVELARVNVSSAITHPWRDSGAPPAWRTDIADSLRRFREALS